MKLYRRPGSDNWYFDYSDPNTGRRIRESTKRTVKAEAAAVAQTIVKTALDKAQFGYAREETIYGTVREYIDARLAGKPYEKSTKSLLASLLVLVDISVKTMPMHRLDTSTVESIRFRLRGPQAYTGDDKRKPTGNRSPATINHYIKLLRAAYNYAKDVGIRVAPNVKFNLERVTTTFRALTDDECAGLIDYFGSVMTEVYVASGETQRFRQLWDAQDLVVLLLGTGARYSEIAGLAWGDVSDDFNFVTIKRGKDGIDGTIALPNDAVEVLKRRRKRASASPWVFPGERDGEHRGMATKAIRKAMHDLGFNLQDKVKRYGRATVHSLRHTFATRLVGRGASLYDVQVLLGHRSPSTTMRYAKVAVSDAALRAKGILDAIPTQNTDPNTSDEQRKSVLNKQDRLAFQGVDLG
jgi:integrase